jgi:hypothetical protein
MKHRVAITAMSAFALMAFSFLAFSPYGGARAQSTGSPDSINATFVMGQLQKEGFVAKLDTDSDSEPRLTFKVDGYEWAIYFYACGAGPTETRPCISYQFYSGYTTNKPVPLTTINKWNTDKRYARAYNYVQRDGKTSSRIEIDVISEGTQADRAETFQIFFKKMKEAAQDFRKHIDFRD